MGFIKPSNVVGTMELLPNEQILFDNVKNIIEDTFKKRGFLPIDTPVFEKNEILLAKGGGETTKQIFKIDSESKDISLRFDLTVPLARYVAQYFSDLNFPFRRYHIGKVYRCDIDVIGNGKLDIKNDAELPYIIYEIFSKIINEKFAINFSNLKIINGLFENLGVDNKTDMLRIIDKIEKIGFEKVVEELKNTGLDGNNLEKIIEFIKISGTNEEIIENLNSLGIKNELFDKGVEELKEVYECMKLFGIPEDYIKINLTITRGLDYYTGTVYETFLENYRQLGSVCSGGRYDAIIQVRFYQVLEFLSVLQDCSINCLIKTYLKKLKLTVLML